MQRVEHSPLKREDPLSQSNTESKPSSAGTMEGFLVAGEKLTFLRNLQNWFSSAKRRHFPYLWQRGSITLPVAACVFQASSVPAHKYLYISKPPQTSSLLVLLSPKPLTFLLTRHLPSERLLSVILFLSCVSCCALPVLFYSRFPSPGHVKSALLARCCRCFQVPLNVVSLITEQSRRQFAFSYTLHKPEDDRGQFL